MHDMEAAGCLPIWTISRFHSASNPQISSLTGTACSFTGRDVPVAWTPNAKNLKGSEVACCLVAECRGRNLQILTDRLTARIAYRYASRVRVPRYQVMYSRGGLRARIDGSVSRTAARIQGTLPRKLKGSSARVTELPTPSGGMPWWGAAHLLAD